MRAAAIPRRRCLQALALAGVPALGAAQGVVTIRLSHVVARQTPKGLALERFRERVQSLSQGRIQVVIYPNSVLFGDADEIQALQLGAVDMLAPSLSKARKVLTLNLAPVEETDGFSPSRHIELLAEHEPRLRLDAVVADPAGLLTLFENACAGVADDAA